MIWNIEFTDEFGQWYALLLASVQDDIDRIVGLLEARGPQLLFPYSSGIEGSRHEHMRNCVSRVRVSRGGYFMLSIRAGPQSC